MEQVRAELLDRQRELIAKDRDKAARAKGATLRKAAIGGAAGRTEASHRAGVRQAERDRAEFDRIVDRELAARKRAGTASAFRGGRAGAQLVRETNQAVVQDRAERARTVASAARSGTLKGRRAAGVRAGREAVRNARKAHGGDPNEPLNLTHTRTIQRGKGVPRSAAPIPHKGETGPGKRADAAKSRGVIQDDTLNLHQVPKQRTSDPVPGEGAKGKHWFFG